MIPTIGVMIGSYIITRMLDLASRRERPHLVVVIAAIITLVTAIGGIVQLIFAGEQAAAQLNLPLP